MRGRLDMREIEDIGDNALSFAEVKALASGDPLILEKATADAERTRLQRLQRAHQRNHQALTHTIASAREQHEIASRQLTAVNNAIAQQHSTRGDTFQMTVAGHSADTRPQAAALISAWTLQHARHTRTEIPFGQIAELGGVPIDAAVRLYDREPVLELALHGLPGQPAHLHLDQVREESISLVRQLEHRVNDLAALAERIGARQQGAAAEAHGARKALGRPVQARRRARYRHRPVRRDRSAHARAPRAQPRC